MFQIGINALLLLPYFLLKITRYIYRNLFDFAKNALIAKNIQCFNTLLLSRKQEWTDVNLKWNTSEYGNVEDIRIPPHKIWKPDVLMYNR